MAAYRRVDDLTVTCRLTACTPGSAPGPTLGIEYGKPSTLRRVCLLLETIVGNHASAGHRLIFSLSGNLQCPE